MSLTRWWIFNLQINLAMNNLMGKLILQWIIWWWQLEWREGWVPLSITKFGWFMKIKSIHDEELESMWVGSYINCSRPWIEVTESICTPSLLDMSYLYQFDDRALKSPIIMVSFWLDIDFTKTSKLPRNIWNSSLDWLSER